MDGRQFDALTRTLTTDTTARRGLFRTAAGGVLAALLGRLGLEEVAAACKESGKCKKNSQCCSGKCKKKRGKKTGKCDPCPSGTKFCDVDGACISVTQCCGTCPSGTTCCTNVGDCVDLFNDPDFCGGCTFRCQGQDVCANGSCAQTCTSNVNCIESCPCSKRVGRSQQICASLLAFRTCDDSPTCTSDADCGFREACVQDLCSGKQVCADPCD